MRVWLTSDWLQVRAQTHGEHVALEFRTDGNCETWTYRELSSKTWAACNQLAAHGVREGSRVALFADDPREAALALHATLRMRATLVLLHRRLAGTELYKELAQTGARWVVSDTTSAWPDGVARIRLTETSLSGVAPGGEHPVEPSPPMGEREWEDILAQLREHRAAEKEVEGDCDSLMLFTSGTTGKSKCAVLTRASLLASAAASALRLGVEKDDRWLACMPLYHVGGLSILLRSVLYGTTAVVLGRFDVDETLHTLRDGAITMVSLVPTMLHRCLAASPGPAPAHLRITLLGGGPATPELVERATVFGWHPCATYGLTEVASQAATVAPDEQAALGGVGKPLPGTLIRIEDEDAEGVGVIALRSPARMRGYLDNARTRDVLHDGWLLTGDLGRVDEHGYLHVLTRRTDLIVSGGENVYPAQVEAALMEIDGLVECTVFGVPDDEWGQRVAAAVVLKPGHSLAEVRREAATRLAGHRLPRAWYAPSALPRTVSGKVRRLDVKRAFLGALDDE